jgi:ATP synthase mitochondrial F1 complex assembly factor 1
MATPHTPAQVSSLWTAYHLSKSGGTGRGYVCASAPLEAYNRMLAVAERYPAFVVPVPRVQDVAEQKEGEAEQETAYEFYFLQWSFYDSPPVPSATEDLFAKPAAGDASPNARTSTVLFTPLQEYKLRGEFATPYFVLTHYTDLSSSHGQALLRGEITPATGTGGVAADGRYMLSQEDAQLLAMTLQRFYLWDQHDGGDGEAKNEGQRLLRTFHEKPEEFKWEDLIKFAKFPIS